MPVGDEAEPAGPAKELLSGQAPDAVPAMPPPSNAVVDVEVPAVEIPVPNDVPAVALPVPDIPDDIPGLTRPNEDSGIEPPMPRHPGLVTVVETTGDAPEVNGLTPGDKSAVAPRGTPAGGTGEAGPMPSGDVTPSGEGADRTCARAGQW
jgi:hypothetical protein